MNEETARMLGAYSIEETFSCKNDASTLRVGGALALAVYALMNLPGAIGWIALVADARVFAGINVVLRG